LESDQGPEVVNYRWDAIGVQTCDARAAVRRGSLSNVSKFLVAVDDLRLFLRLDVRSSYMYVSRPHEASGGSFIGP